MSHTSTITHPTSEAYAIFSESLANARLTALRALLDIVNTTDDPVEKRHAATVILRTPDPNAPRPARTPRQPRPPTPRDHPPTPRSADLHPDPYLDDSIDDPNDDTFIDSVADLPDLPDLPDIARLNLARSMAAIAAAAAQSAPPPNAHNGAP